MKKIIFPFIVLFLFAGAWAAPSGTIRSVASNPKAGFMWGYLLYIPDTLTRGSKVPILFTMNDSGIFDNAAELEKATLERFGRGNEDYIAYELGVPMVLPLIPREKGEVNTHDLNRAAFLLQQGPFKDLSAQVLAMLQDARKQLKKEGIHTHKKFLVAGFSSAGAFGWKWTFLNPKYVLAAAVGGELYPMLPLETKDELKLIFPVGVYDLSLNDGRKFNQKAWSKIPILLTNGAYDYNDPLPYVYGAEDARLVYRIFGEGSAPSRWENAQKLLAKLATNVQTHTYPNLEHEPVQQDMIAFLKHHIKGGPLQPIELTDTSSQKVPFPLTVKQLYWGKNAPITKDRKYLSDTDLVLELEIAQFPFWVRKAVSFDIKQGEKVILSQLHAGGFFNEGGKTFLTVPIEGENLKQLTVRSHMALQVQPDLPELISIPADLTFTVK